MKGSSVGKRIVVFVVLTFNVGCCCTCMLPYVGEMIGVQLSRPERESEQSAGQAFDTEVSEAQRLGMSQVVVDETFVRTGHLEWPVTVPVGQCISAIVAASGDRSVSSVRIVPQSVPADAVELDRLELSTDSGIRTVGHTQWCAERGPLAVRVLVWVYESSDEGSVRVLVSTGVVAGGASALSRGLVLRSDAPELDEIYGAR